MFNRSVEDSIELLTLLKIFQLMIEIWVSVGQLPLSRGQISEFGDFYAFCVETGRKSYSEDLLKIRTLLFFEFNPLHFRLIKSNL